MITSSIKPDDISSEVASSTNVFLGPGFDSWLCSQVDFCSLDVRCLGFVKEEEEEERENES